MPASPTPAAPAGFSESAGRWVLVAAVAASCMVFIDGSALNVALPALQASLGATGAQMLWVLNGYLLVLAALILEGGAAGDRYGHKRACLAGVGLFALASLGCGLAPTISWLIAARVAQGLGGALLVPGSLALISAGFPVARRGAAIGTWSAATTLVTLGGPALGGWLADSGWWRAIFLLNLPLAALAFFVLAAKVPETKNPDAAGTDWRGSVLAAAGLAGLTYGLLTAPGHGWQSPIVWATLGAATLALIAFVWVEKRQAHPMLPLSFFTNATFSGANLLTLLLYGALTAAMFFLSLNLVQAQGYTQLQAGLCFMPMAGSITLLSRLAGKLADRIGPRPLLVAGPLVAGLGFFLLSRVGQTAGPAQFWTTFLPGLLCFGLGMAITVVPLTTAVMTALPDQYAGTASGVNNAVARTAGVLALAVLGAVALSHFAARLEERTRALPLPAQARVELRQQAARLAAAQAPKALPLAEEAKVKAAIRASFLDTYAVMLWICAGMAVAGAGCALMVPGKR